MPNGILERLILSIDALTTALNNSTEVRQAATDLISGNSPGKPAKAAKTAKSAKASVEEEEQEEEEQEEEQAPVKTSKKKAASKKRASKKRAAKKDSGSDDDDDDGGTEFRTAATTKMLESKVSDPAPKLRAFTVSQGYKVLAEVPADARDDFLEELDAHISELASEEEEEDDDFGEV